MKPITSLTISGPDGVVLTLPVDHAGMSDAEKAALAKLVASGDVTSLDASERSLLANKKAFLRAGGPEALIARFDIKFVRID